MSILKAEIIEQPKSFSLWRALIKQLILSIIVGSLVLTFYLAARYNQDYDKSLGKYAYIVTKGDYLGVIKWHGRAIKTGNYIYQIRQPNGDMIEVVDSYVEVRDNPPKFDD